MRILVCPAHFTIGEGSGSESETAVKIIKTVSRFADVTAVVGVQTGKVELPPNVQLVSLYKGNTFSPSPWNRHKFLFDCANAGDTLLKGTPLKGLAFNPDAVYHMFPFDRYHPCLLPWIAKPRVPIVVGPVTLPHDLVRFPDEVGMLLGDVNFLNRGKVFAARLLRPLTTKLMAASASLLHTVIAESRAAKHYYSQWIPKKKIIVVYNYLELERYAFSLPSPSANAIGIVGNLIERKGIDRLISVLPKILGSFPGARLLIVGSGPQEGHLKQLCAVLGLARFVTFTGRVPKKNLAKILRPCAVLVSASRQEAFANTMLEGMALGIPCVAYETASIHEVIDDSIDGYIVPQNRQDLFASRIRALVGDSELRKRCAHAGRNKVEEKFSKTQALCAFTRVFSQLR